MTLADRVKPKTFVFTYLLTRLPFQHITRILTEIPFYIIIVLDLPQKTDALGILPLGIDQMFALSNLTNFVLHMMTDGEQSLTQLPVVNLCQEISLILHGVRTGGEPFLPVDPFSLCIMARGNEIVVFTTLLIEGRLHITSGFGVNPARTLSMVYLVT